MSDIGPTLPNNQFQQVDVAGTTTPSEGPKVTSTLYPFSDTVTSVVTNFLLMMAQQQMSQVVGMFVDNSKNPAPVSIVPSITFENIIVPAFSQALLPIFCPKNATVTVSSTGQTPVTIDWCNFPVPAAVWSVEEGQPARTFTPGQVTLVGGAAAELLAANPDRISAIVSNVAGETIYLGPDNTVLTTTGLAVKDGATFNTNELGVYIGALWCIAAGAGVVTFAEFT